MNKIFKILTFLLLMVSLFILSFSAVILVKVAARYTSSVQSNNSSTGINSTSPSTTPLSGANTSQTNQQATSTGNVKTFTLAELKKYNGKGGNAAYVAVNGDVYDVTGNRKWRNGSHAGYPAGVDLTDFMSSSPHGMSVLRGIPIVGKFVG